jgi:NADH-quinone oxidoreductase subunit N
MASLAGIPLTAGFWGKLFVFKLAVDQGQWILLTVAILGACAGFYYYLKIAASMYLSEPDDRKQSVDNSPIIVGKIASTAMIVMIVAVIAIGINPSLITGLLE